MGEFFSFIIGACAGAFLGIIWTADRTSVDYEALAYFQEVCEANGGLKWNSNTKGWCVNGAVFTLD